jgi:capsular polysaccharide transport system ATP-binding protein
MIEFERVSKIYHTREGHKQILSDASFCFEAGHNYGILGGNGMGKSTLLRMIAGAEFPDAGQIHRRARVSFPLGFAGTFHTHLSGRQNANFLARIYGVDPNGMSEFVAEFSELGPYFDMPMETYSSGMIAKLAFGVSLAIDFDVYLVDEVTEVGDARFRRKCSEAFMSRMSRSDIIMVSHNSHTIKAYCDRGAILKDGHLHFFDSINEAVREHDRMMEE